MITINFLPKGSGSKVTASVSGTVLTVNGESYDLSDMEDGSTVDHPVLKNCTRNGDDYELILKLPHGRNAPYYTRFPLPVVVTGDWTLEYEFGEAV